VNFQTEIFHCTSLVACTFDAAIVTYVYPKRLECYSSIGRAPTSATEPSVQLDLESDTICRQTSYSPTCHTAVSDSRWRCFMRSMEPQRSVNPS